MSQAVIFEIGAVVFVAVTAVVFLYGVSAFGEWQDRDDARADVGNRFEAAAGSNAAIAPGEDRAEVLELDRARDSQSRSPSSAA